MSTFEAESEWLDASADRHAKLSDCSFNLEHYRAILKLATDLGYRCVGCAEYLRDPSGMTLLLRHDVDLSLVDAVKMAEVEAECGSTSTFFVRVSARSYDVRSRAAAAQLRRLLALGCELGLHYDVGRWAIDPEAVAGALSRARDVLEMAAGVQVIGGTMHMPRLAVVYPSQADKRTAGLMYDPGDPEFNSMTRFMSDSRRSWSDGCLCNHVGWHPKLYALIHPFWWCHTDIDVGGVLRRLRSGE